MNKVIAKFLYVRSVCSDMSEMPLATARETERQLLYMRRTGSDRNCSPTKLEWWLYAFSPWVVGLALFVAVLAIWRP